ncbi:uncharacterized protein B0H64DRAFT_200282 [Chaetomium fimeti]|uniref:Uncharacterized protein n=1 Tax=Chaetomium fimeti TaxID=1854472 RepID=A0AAE0LRV8_9PEZI|nr:hypothetical protein B0H64DRAFT_200282 [Chaetomium fimeti]
MRAPNEPESSRVPKRPSSSPSGGDGGCLFKLSRNATSQMDHSETGTGLAAGCLGQVRGPGADGWTISVSVAGSMTEQGSGCTKPLAPKGPPCSAALSVCLQRSSGTRMCLPRPKRAKPVTLQETHAPPGQCGPFCIPISSTQYESNTFFLPMVGFTYYFISTTQPLDISLLCIPSLFFLSQGNPHHILETSKIPLPSCVGIPIEFKRAFGCLPPSPIAFPHQPPPASSPSHCATG